MKKCLSLISLILISYVAVAQSVTYGNEWIDYSKTYYKIKVGQNAIHRVVPSQLQGFTASANNLTNFQLINKGVQVPLYFFDSNGNGSFDSNDYVEFYGVINDGQADSSLFINKSDQPHKKYSMFTDSNAYFLVNGNTPGLRYANVNGSNISGTSEPYYKHQELLMLTNYYSFGTPILVRSFRSDYTGTAGWCDTKISKGGSRDYTIPVSNHYSSAGTPTIEIMGVGQSDGLAINPAPNNRNHHVRISIGPNTSSLVQIYDSLYNGYTAFKTSKSLLNSYLSGSTILRMQVINDVVTNVGQSYEKLDDQSFCYALLSYPRNFDLGSQSKANICFTGTGAMSRFTFTNYGKSLPILYDITNNTRITGQLSSGTFNIMVNNTTANQNFVLLDQTDAITNATVSRVQFRNLNPSTINHEFIVLTHKSLLNAAKTYAGYRADATAMGGGGYDTLVVSSEEIANQFFYGVDHHPRAVKNFIHYLIDGQAVDPKFLFLLGKSYEMQLLRKQGTNYNQLNMLPVYGGLGSDNMLTFGINGYTLTPAALAPAVPIGRMATTTEAQILDYLMKIKSYEHRPKEDWQKIVLDGTGGNNSLETRRFRGYMNSFEIGLNSGSFGPNYLKYDYDVSKPFTVDPPTYVRNIIDQGINMYMYFGHGADLRMNIDLGNVSAYNNLNKYPFMYFSGCRVGNAFGESFSYGEDFTLAQNKGAIGWFAGVDLGYETFLRDYGVLFTQNLSGAYYGQPIGNIIKATTEQFPILTDISITQSQQMLLQCDPALRLYNCPQPDYKITSVQWANPESTATSDSLIFVLNILNTGREVNGDFNISLVRTLPNGNTVTYPLKRVNAPGSQLIYSFVVKSKDPLTAGANTFTFKVDATSEIPELEENNNEYIFPITIDLEKVNLIYPSEFSIVSASPTNLIFQNTYLQAVNKTYTIEIDTTPSFSSAWKQTTNQFSAYSTVEKSQTLPFNNTVYYTRAKISSAATWGTTSSFRYLNGSSPGWSQAHTGQFNEIYGSDVYYDISTKQFNFVRDQVYLAGRTSRFLNGAQGANYGLRADEILLSGGNNCSSNIFITYYSPFTLDGFNGTFASCNTLVRKARAFNITTTAGQTDFENFLNTIPTGYYMAMTTNPAGGAPNSQFLNTGNIPTLLGQYGASATIISALNTVTSYSLAGRKGFPAVVSEDTVISNTTAWDPLCDANVIVEGKWYKGSIASELIGPARSWSEVNWAFNSYGTPSADKTTMTVVGVKENGTSDTLYKRIATTPINLTSVDAAVYPYVYITANVYDSLERSAPQLSQWTVLYNGIAETSVFVDAGFSIPDTIYVTDPLNFAYKLKNLSSNVSDSLFITYTLMGQAGNTQSGTDLATPLNPGQVISKSGNFTGMAQFLGANVLDIKAYPRKLTNEEYLGNNRLCKTVYVKNIPNPLSVELLEFKAELNTENTSTNLNWKTANEQNTDKFIVQRKHKTEAAFIDISAVNAVGGNNNNVYTTTDNVQALEDGTIYYRLKMIDADGSLEYSNIEAVELRRVPSISLFPVPAKSTINVDVEAFAQGKIRYEITNSQGQLVYKSSEEVAVSMGHNNFTIDITKLAPGVYTFKTSIGNQEISKSFIKTNDK